MSTAGNQVTITHKLVFPGRRRRLKRLDRQRNYERNYIALSTRSDLSAVSAFIVQTARRVSDAHVQRSVTLLQFMASCRRQCSSLGRARPASHHLPRSGLGMSRLPGSASCADPEDWCPTTGLACPRGTSLPSVRMHGERPRRRGIAKRPWRRPLLSRTMPGADSLRSGRPNRASRRQRKRRVWRAT